MTTKRKLGPYKSNEYLGAYVGTRGLVKLSYMKVLDVDEPEDLMNSMESSGRRNVNGVTSNSSSIQTHAS
ncbi:hypothetical protein K457DRAFT_1870488 [Linnemannia elongata AG-77]|uniref:Uncharacterized protein n=1 Tax=Linnemannia elongata AG-77 TaxID=1314771 RepID=A0A197KBD3_9FUNG|nr:hypothetical protein K457DRAFT_1870488 [Linnemannia elongata AG-77]